MRTELTPVCSCRRLLEAGSLLSAMSFASGLSLVWPGFRALCNISLYVHRYIHVLIYFYVYIYMTDAALVPALCYPRSLDAGHFVRMLQKDSRDALTHFVSPHIVASRAGEHTALERHPRAPTLLSPARRRLVSWTKAPDSQLAKLFPSV